MHESSKNSIFLFAGEQSGDQLGGRLMSVLRKRAPELHLCGVGGPLMRAQEIDLLEPMEKFQAHGISDIARGYLRFRKLFFLVKEHILKTQPTMVLLIDFPMFNLKMMEHLRDAGYKGQIVQYVAPSVWAHSPGRAEILEKYADRLLTIFEFEAKYFAHTKLPVTFVGDPLSDQPIDAVGDKTVVSTDAPLLGVFPGSRPSEIARNLKVQLEAAKLLRKEWPKLHIAISSAREELVPAIKSHVEGISNCEVLAPHHTRDLMREADLAFATCGTVNRELAWYEVPTVVTYRLTMLSVIWAKFWLKVNLPYYNPVNIATEKEVYPEYIHLWISPKQLADSAAKLLRNGEARKSCVEACRTLRANSRCELPTSKQAAEAVLAQLGLLPALV